MNTKKQIVCISHLAWTEIPHRTQALLSQFKSIEVLYFTPFDPKSTNKMKKVKPHITVYPLPQEGNPNQNTHIIFSLRQRRLAQFITRTMQKHHFRNPLLWVTHPLQEEMSCHINYHSLVYDCSQLWENDYLYPQEYLFRKADLIFVHSKKLKQQMKYFHKNISILENGVDFPLFERASLFARPQLREKRFGFAGEIDPDMDLSPLIYTAEAMPQWKFFLLGTCAMSNPYLDRLSRLYNVKFYGSQAPHIVPEFLYSCHVLLEFRRNNHPVRDSNSIRLYQYCATGRPIVRDVWKGEPVRLSHISYLAHTHPDFLDQCKAALSENTPVLERKRISIAQNSSWEKRAQQVEDLLKTSGLL